MLRFYLDIENQRGTTALLKTGNRKWAVNATMAQPSTILTNQNDTKLLPP